MQPTFEEALKPLFERWLEEKMPDIRQELRTALIEDADFKSQQTLFNQQEMATRQNVSVTTFREWRKAGLESEPNPTGKLLFDLNKVNAWRENNPRSKVSKKS